MINHLVIKLGQLTGLVMATIFKKELAQFVVLGPKSKPSFNYQPNAIKATIGTPNFNTFISKNSLYRDK